MVPKASFALLGMGAGAGNIVQQPGELGAGEIRVEQKPGLRRDGGLEALIFEFGAERCGATVLPDDGVVQRLAGLAMPQDVVSRWLVMPMAAMAPAGAPDAASRDTFQRRLPNLLRVVLDPTVLRVELAMLRLRRFARRAGEIEQDGAARRGALIDGEDELAIVRHRGWSGIMACHGDVNGIWVWPARGQRRERWKGARRLISSLSMLDPFGRKITYLRVSVTDRCDFRCVYCMAEDMTFLPRGIYCRWKSWTGCVRRSWPRACGACGLRAGSRWYGAT